MYNLQATLREITVLDLPVTEITVEVVDVPMFLDLSPSLTEITVEVVDLPIHLDMSENEVDDQLPPPPEVVYLDLDFGPSEPFAPYSEVRFLTSEILPYGTRFGIPYFKEEVRHRHHLVKGATHWSEPSPEDDFLSDFPDLDLDNEIDPFPTLSPRDLGLRIDNSILHA